MYASSSSSRTTGVMGTGVTNHRVRDEFAVKGESDVIKCGNEAVKILAYMDEEKSGN